jgi:hypothetical protein
MPKIPLISNITDPLLKSTDFRHCKLHQISNTSTDPTNICYATCLYLYRSSGNDAGQSVYLGKDCNADLSDVAFFDMYGNYCDYWIEHDSCYSDGRFVVWIRMPHFTPVSNNYLLILYGGMNRSSFRVNNGGYVFNNFNDFELRPNWSNWNQSNSNGKAGSLAYLAGGGSTRTYPTASSVRITAGSTNAAFYMFNVSFRTSMTGYSWAQRGRFKGSIVYNGPQPYYNVSLGGNATDDMASSCGFRFAGGQYGVGDVPGTMMRVSSTTLYTSPISVSADTWYVLETKCYNNSINNTTYYINDSQVGSYNAYYANIYGMYCRRNGFSVWAECDWTTNRNIVYPEPTHIGTISLW